MKEDAVWVLCTASVWAVQLRISAGARTRFKSLERDETFLAIASWYLDVAVDDAQAVAIVHGHDELLEEEPRVRLRHHHALQ